MVRAMLYLPTSFSFQRDARSPLRSLEPVMLKKIALSNVSVRAREIACIKVFWERGRAIFGLKFPSWHAGLALMRKEGCHF